MPGGAQPLPEIHNPGVQKALHYLHHHLPTFAIVDKGRDGEENSCIWVEQGKLHGEGYINPHADLASPEAVKETLTPYPSNHYMMQLMYRYAEKHPTMIWEPGQVSALMPYREKKT